MSEVLKLWSWRFPVAFALAGVALQAPLLVTGEQALAIPAAISGRAVVIDGDTLEIGQTRIRLEGIDAPETGQTCGRRWIGSWNCGAAAAAKLGDLVDGRRVECQSRGKDKYGRMIGLCAVDGEDLNGAMVRAGFAWAFVKYSTSYVDAEAEAKAGEAGIWQGASEAPWDYRAKRWANAEDEAPEGCAIKGNVTANGNIYHMPWSAWYGKVKVEQAKGERWFCSESEAQSAGWRPAMSH